MCGESRLALRLAACLPRWAGLRRPGMLGPAWVVMLGRLREPAAASRGQAGARELSVAVASWGGGSLGKRGRDVTSACCARAGHLEGEGGAVVRGHPARRFLGSLGRALLRETQ